MTNRAQIVSAVSGTIALATFFLSASLGGFLSPLPPLTPAAAVARFYQENVRNIQISLIVEMFSVSLLLAFFAGVSAVIRDIEKDRTPTWSYISLASALLGMAPLLCATCIWAAAAFRPDRAPEILLALHDAATILFLAPAPPTVVLLMAVGFAILGDRRPVRVFPPWFGVYSIIGAIITIPACLVMMEKTGPFAWDGVWGNFAPLIGSVSWSLVAQYYMIRAACGGKADVNAPANASTDVTPAQ